MSTHSDWKIITFQSKHLFHAHFLTIYNWTHSTTFVLVSWSQAGDLVTLLRALIMFHHVNPPSVLLGYEQSRSEAPRLWRAASVPERCNRRTVPTWHQRKPVSRLHSCCRVYSPFTGCSCAKRCPLLSGLSNHSVPHCQNMDEHPPLPFSSLHLYVCWNSTWFSLIFV